MKTQFDYSKRIVSLENLRAMCARISGTCHRFTVGSVNKAGTRVTVSYSNPDEYGRDNPVTAVFPTYPGADRDVENPAVVLDAIDYRNSPDEEWQAFWSLYDCPPLFRVSSDRNEWRSEYEILIARANNENLRVTSSWNNGGCVQRWRCNGQDFASFDKAVEYAVAQLRAAEESQRLVAKG